MNNEIRKDDFAHVNEEYVRKTRGRVEKLLDIEGLFKMLGQNIEDVDDLYPGYSSYVRNMMKELSSILDDAVEYAIAQDRLYNKQKYVNQIMVGMIEKQRRQLMLMDAKLDILLDIEKANEE